MSAFMFRQNNSGGSYIDDVENGIGEYVIVEREDESDAIQYAKELGVYFNGVQKGIDCECCGDRWELPDEYVTVLDALEDTNVLEKDSSIFIHYQDGSIERKEGRE